MPIGSDVSSAQLAASAAGDVASAMDLVSLKRKAIEMRRLILKSVAKAGAGHIGGPLSATDLLIALYFHELKLDPTRPDWEDRDRFILSKGHSSIALYTVLALRGYMPVSELDTFDAIDSRLQGHPDMTKLPGVDMSSGSLGVGFSPAVGMAIGARLLRKSFRAWAMLGDGEIQEGQVWEAAFIAARYKLDNLTAILDYNKLQQYGWAGTETPRRPRISIEDPAAKFAAFGWNTIEIDGHDFSQILGAFALAKSTVGQPTIIIANTVKGKGISFMENEYGWHAKPPSKDELAAALAELDAAERLLNAPTASPAASGSKGE